MNLATRNPGGGLRLMTRTSSQMACIWRACGLHVMIMKMISSKEEVEDVEAEPEQLQFIKAAAAAAFFV